MSACASLPGHINVTAQPALSPIVFVEDIAEPRLAVQSMQINGPLDERSVTLTAPAAIADRTLASHWQGRDTAVTLPHRLVDDEQRWSVLTAGVIEPGRRTSAPGQESSTFDVIDRWSEMLHASVPAVWWSSTDAALLRRAHGVLLPGPAGNRSTQTFNINGMDVHLLQLDGQPWTVGAALATLSAFVPLDLSLQLLPPELKNATLLQAVDLSMPIGDALRRVLEPYGLVVRRELWRDGHTIVEQRHVRAAHHGRPISLRWAGDKQSVADALRIDHDAQPDAAQRWEAHANGWLIESTFELVGGWDPALEGAADSAYDRTLSSDFAQYANVYRHWVLNEDGRFTEAPFNRGAPFDLAAFFADSTLQPQALPLLPCVTLDDTNAPRAPVVEISTDSGSTWSQYPGQVVVQSQRAAVYLDDDALPGSFLTAAKNGTARVRVTASLRNPHPVTAMRWLGNPFAGQRTTRVLRVDDAFAFRRVHADSIHHSAVQSGSLNADEIDQTGALEHWLLARVREAGEGASRALDGRGRIDLAGAWPWLRPGDRLIDAGGDGQTPTGRATAVMRHGALVHALDMRFGVSRHSGPSTTAYVHF